jgi:hypothetical protein
MDNADIRGGMKTQCLALHHHGTRLRQAQHRDPPFRLAGNWHRGNARDTDIFCNRQGGFDDGNQERKDLRHPRRDEAIEHHALA